MVYAIIETSGKQIWIEPGKFYDVNYINGEPGDMVKLYRVLLFKNEEQITIGKPCINSIYVKAQILKHFKGKKITVFKMKSKKSSKVKQGHRQKLTRLLVKEIIKS
uniref:50S ribosomal protein L21, chloroplastic n=1 Tax=Riquetophycus sp. TaxID=1897556 RepID=A0A1C9C8A2_9FLOR|nr:ribosomal protein L21 [Riquetophycus sp.]